MQALRHLQALRSEAQGTQPWMLLQEHIPAAKLYALGRLGQDNISSNHGSALDMCIGSCADWGVKIRKDNLGVTKALYSFTQYATHAEAHVASLCSEMTTVTKYLSSINKMLKSCRHNASALALVDAELWRQSDLALQDCEATLNDLSTFVAKLTTSNKTPFWRAKVAFDMSIHARKLDEFRARLKRSNCALHTVLQTIVVSFSLQNNASQELILLELKTLKECIEETVWVAKRSPVSTGSSLTAQSESMATKNLNGLVKAAENLHSSATTTVGSSLGGSIADWPTPAIETGSIAGLTPFRTERLHEYIQNTSQESNPFAATLTETRASDTTEFPEYLIADGSAEPTKDHFMPMKPTFDADFQLRLHDVLEDFAIEKMKHRDFDNAATFLKQALSGEMGPVAETKVGMRLQIRLGICYVLQRKIPEARKVISKLERNDGLENVEVLHLMHALAMVHFAKCEFAEAKHLCERVLKAKMRFFGMSHPQTLTSLGFSRYLYDQLDQPIEMEATRRLMPHDYVYKHPKSEFDFLAQHAMLMPAIALEPEPGPVELPCTYVAESSQDAQMTQNEYLPNHHLKRALTRYETQQTNAMKVFLSATVTHPDEEEFCPGPGISASRNGPSRMISRSMTTVRRHLGTWRSSKLAAVRKKQAVTEDPSVQRCRTVLHKAPPGSQMDSARFTGLTRAKRFLSILNKERPIITAPTEETLQVFELDATCVPRKDLVQQLADTGEAQKTFADQGVQASLSDAPPSEPLRVSVPPLDMSLCMIPELPELDSGCGYDPEDPATIVIEDSNNSSDGSISRESSNRSTVSGSSYSTNTTFSEVSPASPVDCGDFDNSTALRSVSQQFELFQPAQNDPDPSIDRPKTLLSSRREDVLLPSQRSYGGTRALEGLLAAHRYTHSMHKPYGRDRLPNTLPTATDLRHGSNNNGYPSQSPDQTTEALPDISTRGWSDGSGETHGLKRSFSWSYGDENLSIIKLPNSEEIPSLLEVVVVLHKVDDQVPADYVSKHSVPVRYRQSPANSLNQKLWPDPGYKTQAILLSDDDVYYHPSDVEFAFQAWREFGRDRMTGAFARCAEPIEDGKLKYSLCSKDQDAYAMVLTGLAFSHISFMDYYWSDEADMTNIRNYVDQHMNCEDIAMNHVASLLTGQGPLQVAGRKKHVNMEPAAGISSKPGHAEARSKCLDDFADIFKCKALINETGHIQRSVVLL